MEGSRNDGGFTFREFALLFLLFCSSSGDDPLALDTSLLPW